VRATAEAISAQSLPNAVFGARNLQQTRDSLAMLAQAHEHPFNMYAHCFCELK
jgi:hypothetical protein